MYLGVGHASLSDIDIYNYTKLYHLFQVIIGVSVRNRASNKLTNKGVQPQIS